MKRFLALALCALFTLNAGARTLYVDARRPNNNGNGLSAKKAKKTIQAAVNIARKGDTILVRPGTYSPIRTNNRKIAIKSVRGAPKTKIHMRSSSVNSPYALDLGARNGSKPAGGTATRLSGFTCFSSRLSDKSFAVAGGSVSHCRFNRVGGGSWGKPTPVFTRCKLSRCVLVQCWGDTVGGAFISKSTLSDCSIQKTGGQFATGWYFARRYTTPTVFGGYVPDIHAPYSAVNAPLSPPPDPLDPQTVKSCKLVRCSFRSNSGIRIKDSTLIGCTFAGNHSLTKANCSER